MASSSPASNKSQGPKPRKRVDVNAAGLKRAADGSAFTRCDICKRNIPVATADMHDCEDDIAIKAKLHDDATRTVLEEPKVKKAKKKSEADDKQVAKEVKQAKDDKQVAKKAKQAKKAKKDPKMPKRPQTAFFLFMEDFRTQMKSSNNGSTKGSQASKLAGERWKEMTDEEKSPYVKRAAELKAAYDAAVKELKDSDGKKSESLQAENVEGEEVSDNLEED